jgi:thymidylate synthase (FAD)
VSDATRTPSDQAPADPSVDESAVVFRSDVTVELVKASASDADVVWAARVSTKGEQSLEDVDADAERSKGLINYLMRDRHGCYDADTEVLTDQGWKAWPDVTGDEAFMSRAPDGRITFDYATRLVAKHVRGPMIRMRKTNVDLLVTPDHNMLARRRRQPHREAWELVPAHDFLEASHRIPMGGGDWSGEEWYFGYTPGVSALLGFFIGDGWFDGRTTPTFRLRKEREIRFLHEQAERAGYSVSVSGDRHYLIADEEFRLLAKKCYDDQGRKIIPREVLDQPREELEEVLLGLMHSDGSTSASGKENYCTTSRPLVDGIQELAVKVGRAAVFREHRHRPDDGHLGDKPVYRMTIYRQRNLTPRLGATTSRRADEVQVVDYDGMVYCVTVPHSVLYVRRNGIPAWCGNTPFEHNSLTYYVQAPIFVFREFMRHRIASYNEESGRYRELQPVFYVPGPDRKLVQQGKPGAYEFVDGPPELHQVADEATRHACLEAYRAYRRMLDAGVAREVARGVLPVATYSSMYVTMNARSLMNFLSLRTKDDSSAFPSFPQREIEMVAELMEAEWARLMPLTHAAFQANGRVAP